MKPYMIAIGAMADVLATNIANKDDARIFETIANACEYGPHRYRRKLEEIAMLEGDNDHIVAAGWAAITLLDEADLTEAESVWDCIKHGALEAKRRTKNAIRALRAPANQHDA